MNPKTLMTIMALALCALAVGCNPGDVKKTEPPKPDVPAQDSDGDGKPDVVVEKTPAVKACNIAAAKCVTAAELAKEHRLIDCPDSECTSRIDKDLETAKLACEAALSKCLDDACTGGKKAPEPKAKTRKVKKAKCPTCPELQNPAEPENTDGATDEPAEEGTEEGPSSDADDDQEDEAPVAKFDCKKALPHVANPTPDECRLAEVYHGVYEAAENAGRDRAHGDDPL